MDVKAQQENKSQHNYEHNTSQPRMSMCPVQIPTTIEQIASDRSINITCHYVSATSSFDAESSSTLITGVEIGRPILYFFLEIYSWYQSYDVIIHEKEP
jgi:hypothetical protein